MKRKLLIAVMATVLCCLFTVQAFAAPYQNYNFNRGWVTAEPQAYVPYKVLDAVSMGVLTNDGTEGLDFKEPQDMAISTKNGDIAIADRGNSRVVIINKSYILKQYISPKRTSSVTELILDDNGEPKLDADGNKQYKTIEVDITGFDFKGKREKLTAPEGVTFDNEGGLYICDTGNSRIIRFVLSGDEYVCDFIFEKPEGLDDLLSSGGDTQTQTSPGVTTDVTGAPTGEVTDAPTDEVTDAPTEDVTGAPTDEVTDGPTDEVTEAPTEEVTEVPTDEVTETPGTGETLEPGTTGGTPVESTKYTPIKVVVSSGGAMYVVSKGNHKGLIELSSDGSFTKFTGATKVQATLSALIRRLLTDVQKSKMTLNLSTEYSNVCLDSDGMIFGTVANITAEDLYNHFLGNTEIGAAIKRIAPTGADILKRNDLYPPSGDQYYNAASNDSRSYFSYMVDVAVASDGVYSALDRNKGRIFTYNTEGELLYVFGAKGSTLGSFSNPVAIGIFPHAVEEIGTSEGIDATTYGQMILGVLDSTTGQITLFKPTEYGELVRKASMCQLTRQYDEAIELWGQVIDQASSSRLAYNGIGRIQYLRGSYQEACDSFMNALNQDEYSTAYAKLRNEKLEVVMPYLMTGIIVIILFFIGRAAFKKARRFIKTGGKSDDE